MLLAVLLCGAAGLAAGTASAETAEATFVAQDFSISGPDRIEGGVTSIRMVNRGQVLHHLQFVLLPQDKTAADLAAAVRADPAHLPRWIRYVGGPNAVVPGQAAGATVQLEPGNYVVLCLIQDEHGTPHYARGMQRPLAVAGTHAVPDHEPVGDVTLTQVDYAFGLSHPIAAGPHTVRVINRGTITHEAVLVRLAKGATAKEFLASIAPGASGPLRGTPIGGIVGVEPGGWAYFTAEFQPGAYVWICLFPDAETGAPHATRGMVSEFTVK
jgi:hypothetical protein